MDCCNSDQLQARTQVQRKILWIALIINAGMFVLEFIFGLSARSTSLLADSLDMLGDAFVYGLSLYAVAQNLKVKSRVSLVSGSSQLILSFVVFGEAIHKIIHNELPGAETMGVLGAVALAANFIVGLLLLRFRHDDINMKAVWLCTRNDVVANISTIIASVLVFMFQSKWPDIVVGLLVGGLILRSAVHVIRESLRGLKQ